MEAADHRRRRACENCRRKKCRCTGEHPVCSYCRRLNLDCVYLPRAYPADASSNRVTKMPSLQDGRFQRLENQVTQIYSMLNSISSHNRPDSTTILSGEYDESPIDTGTQASASNASRDSTLHNISQLETAPHVLDHLIVVYRAKLHFQPLPLFDPRTLHEVLVNAQPYLFWSFLALVSPLSDPGSPGHAEPETLLFYRQSAESAVMKAAADGVPRLDIVQSLCLLALKDVMEKKLNRAWMTIGTASRLEALRQSKRRHAGRQISVQDESSRCYWSVFILERIFGASESNLVDLETAPEYVPSCPTPPPYYHDDRGLDQEDSREVPKYVGINAHYIGILMIWVKVASYLHRIRSGRLEIPWSADSTYAKLNIEILDYDAQLQPAHRLKNRGLPERLRAELAEEQEYWHPWLMMQIVSHACLALINHPFLHLGIMPARGGRQQSGAFLQQTVDHSVFHSGWVLRILSTFETLPFQLNDPSVGHLVAAIATIPWIFQFARDSRVSTRAREDVAKCVALLERISLSWPHLSRKLKILQSLQATASCQLWDVGSRNTTVTFHSSKLWQLLDSNLADEFYARTEAPGDGLIDEQAPDVMMHVATRYVDPLEDADTQQAPDVAGSTLPNAGAFDNLCENDSLSLFLPEDFEWLQTF
ncbi:Zn(2)-C6 fungal-type DNA-binding domain [Fusarium oxysporum f. sp. vasinfectum]|nr:Zn(2)-C6 fungal-type DNA-binding domain [Fusarium oxysporum f. sp. vasinfectum]